MTRGANKRLRATENAIRSKPYLLAAIDSAYAKFLRTGELPEDRSLAWHVLERALSARKEAADKRVYTRRIVSLPEIKPISGPPRERVFKEAVHEFKPARDLARFVISVLVRSGRDPTDVEFIPSDVPMHDFGSTAMFIVGWPDQFVRSPYEPQMERVLRQHAELRENNPRTDAWYREAAPALAKFLTEGVIPTDDDLRLFALTTGEMFAIHAHYFGRGGEELLAAYEAVATATGAERAAALDRLGKLQARWRGVRRAEDE